MMQQRSTGGGANQNWLGFFQNEKVSMLSQRKGDEKIKNLRNEEIGKIMTIVQLKSISPKPLGQDGKVGQFN